LGGIVRKSLLQRCPFLLFWTGKKEERKINKKKCLFLMLFMPEQINFVKQPHQNEKLTEKR
jgi:hypothetical protein